MFYGSDYTRYKKTTDKILIDKFMYGREREMKLTWLRNDEVHQIQDKEVFGEG